MRDPERPPVRPAVGGGQKLLFLRDHQVRELPVRRGPGVADVLCERAAELVAHRAEEVRPDDGVLFRADEEAGVFVGYLLEGRVQGAHVVDVRGVGVQRAGERCRLVAVRLVGLVEYVVEAGYFCEEGVVE